MAELTPAYDSILNQYLDWAREREDVRAVVVVGSRARSDHPADQWADLDIITFTRAPGLYFGESSWIDRFGEVWAKTRNRTAGNDPEWLVCYAGGLDVDFVFNDVRQVEKQVRLWAALERFPVVGRVLPRQTLARIEHGKAMGAATFARGLRIALDKDGLLRRTAGLLGEPPPYQPPAADEFARRVDNYWLMVDKIAKKICRGELAVALGWMGSLYWSALLPMIEWHARATRGGQTDTWHAGRFMEEWADPRVVAALPGIYAPYEPDGARAALLASMEMFGWLAEETAFGLGFEYSGSAGSKVSAYVREIVL